MRSRGFGGGRHDNARNEAGVIRSSVV